METELTKPPMQDEQIATYKHLYSVAWERGFNETMFLMAQQYNIELLVEVPETGEQVPSPLVKFWRESLEGLTPNQMRQGLRGYMASERRSFKPTPEDIRENGMLESGDDRPRAEVKRDCQTCGGSGWKQTKTVLGNRAVGRCDCRVIVYQGQTYHPPRLEAPKDGKQAAANDSQEVNPK